MDDATVKTHRDAPRVFSPAYYERLSQIEERHWWSIGMREIERALLELECSEERPRDILDAGCGTGQMLGWLCRFAGGRTVRGVDLSEEAIAQCQRRGHAAVCRASVTELPFRDCAFDLVHCGDVLQHLPVAEGTERALAEFYRILRPGGVLFLRTNGRRRAEQGSGSYRRFSASYLRSCVESAGFRIRRLSYANSLPSLPEIARELRHRETPRSHDRGLAVRLLPRHLEWLNRWLVLWLRLEGWAIARLGTSLPFGRTLVCLAVKPSEPSVSGER
jgi:SAM-dependent methyltransferase